jgi:hypothetical protein
MTTYFFFMTDGTITQTTNVNPQAAYNHLVTLGLVSTTSEIVSVHAGDKNAFMRGESVTGSPDLKNQIEDWQPEYPDDGPDPDGEIAMERYYDARACAQDWNTPPQYR